MVGSRLVPKVLSCLTACGEGEGALGLIVLVTVHVWVWWHLAPVLSVWRCCGPGTVNRADPPVVTAVYGDSTTSDDVLLPLMGLLFLSTCEAHARVRPCFLARTVEGAVQERLADEGKVPVAAGWQAEPLPWPGRQRTSRVVSGRPGELLAAGPV